MEECPHLDEVTARGRYMPFLGFYLPPEMDEVLVTVCMDCGRLSAEAKLVCDYPAFNCTITLEDPDE